MSFSVNTIIHRFNQKINQHESFSANEMVELGHAIVLSSQQKEKILEQFTSMQSSFSVEQKIMYVNVAKQYIKNTALKKHIKIPHMDKIPIALWSKEEAKTERELEKWLASVLDIEMAPTSDMKESYKAMKEFCISSWKLSAEDIERFRSQYNKIPLISRCFQELRASYENWSLFTDDPTMLDDHKKIIEKQQENLVGFSRLLSTIVEQDRLSEILTDDKFEELGLAYFFTGGGSFDESIAASIRADIGNLIAGHPVPSEDATASKPPKFPVSEDVLKPMVNLHEKLRAAKQWGYKQRELTPLGTSASEVYALPTDQPQAYLKMSESSMEKKVWDAACIMGDAKHFTATTMSEKPVGSALQVSTGKEQVSVWKKTPEGDLELEEYTDLKEAPKGGMQAKIEGVTLETYVDHPKRRGHDISRSNFIDGTIEILVYGMSDAHLKNMIVTPDGEIIFFDNTRSLHHSNGGILRLIHEPPDTKHVLSPSLRSGLLYLNESFAPLTDDERTKIRKKLNDYQSKVTDLKKYYDDQKKMMTKDQALRRNPNEFNPDLVIPALEERLSLMLEAIDDPNVINLRDLSLASQPNMRFYAALAIIKHIDRSMIKNPADLMSLRKLQTFQAEPLALIGYDSINDLIEHCVRNKINPRKILDLCNDSNRSFDEITRAIIKLIQSPSSKWDKYTCVVEGQQILNDLSAQAKIDWKDNNQQLRDHYAKQITNKLASENRAIKKIHKAGHFFAVTNEEMAMNQLDSVPLLTPILYLLIDRNPHELKIAYKSLDGNKHTLPAINNSDDQKINFGTYSLNAEELKKVFSLPKYFHPECDRETAEKMLNKAVKKHKDKNFALMRQGLEPGSIVISVIKADKRSHDRFEVIPGRPNALRHVVEPPKEITLADLEQYLKDNGYTLLKPSQKRD